MKVFVALTAATTAAVVVVVVFIWDSRISSAIVSKVSTPCVKSTMM